VISASQSADPAPEAEATVREFLARLEPPPVARARRRLVWVAALAAAAVLAAAWLYHRNTVSPQGRAPILLGTGVIVLREPIGPDSDFATFSWTANVRPGTHFSILIWRDEGPESELLDKVPLLDDATRWTPTPEMLKRWPDAIRWEVRAQEAAADHEEWTSGAASRSRH
jgi:hypothetical protein